MKKKSPVKKKAIKRSELDATAMKLGATVTRSNGQKFNTSKKKITPMAARPAKKAASPAPAPIESPKVDQKEVVTAIASASADMQKVIEELRQQIAAIKFEAAQPPTEWLFDFVRNEQGYVTQIKASAPKPRLNS